MSKNNIWKEWFAKEFGKHFKGIDGGVGPALTYFDQVLEASLKAQAERIIERLEELREKASTGNLVETKKHCECPTEVHVGAFEAIKKAIEIIKQEAGL